MRQPVVRAEELLEPTALVAFAHGEDAAARRMAAARRIMRGAAWALQAALLVALALLFFLRAPQVAGRSMEPQLQAGDHVLIDTLAYDLRLGGHRFAHFRDFRRGEVVAFIHPGAGERHIYLKRVIGLPGERVAIIRGAVKINASALVESYHTIADGADAATLVVPAGMIYVLGDNRRESDDSRSFGPVPADTVVGRASFIVWPPYRARQVY